MEGKAFGRITRGERCRGQRHAVSISLVPEIRMFSVERACGIRMKMDRSRKIHVCAEMNLPNEIHSPTFSKTFSISEMDLLHAYTSRDYTPYASSSN